MGGAVEPVHVMGGRVVLSQKSVLGATEESRTPYRLSSGHVWRQLRNMAWLRSEVESFRWCRRTQDGGKTGILGRPQVLNLVRREAITFRPKNFLFQSQGLQDYGIAR